ncbi:alpha/beta fold hydrolase [Leifsonia sp. 22587]|uniref:alpha/beta fold hydrolase n=1 Tax=Leifsonia sp. 22587 TaxID=3453946 RepID=UPI003F860C90
MTGAEHPLAVPVRGGTLAGGDYNPHATGAPLLAVHGITANHVAWMLAAAALPDRRIIAPDLRGRGRSAGLPGPFTLNDHADDLTRVLDALEIERTTVAGHSMGAFVAVRLAQRHPDRVERLVLIDGGLPIPLPEGVPPEDLPAVVLGPALERLRMRFPSAQAYEDFWRAHPAIGPWWNAAIADYVAYDLVGEEPELRSSVDPAAVSVNALELDGSAGYADALAGLRLPIDFVRAPRGLLDGPPLYETSVVEEWGRRLPDLRAHEAHDVNHYTILMTEGGLRQVVPVLDPKETHA